MNSEPEKISQNKRRTIDAITRPDVTLGNAEKRAVNWWCRSRGSMSNFLDYADGDERYLAVLLSEPVRQMIDYLAKRGACMNLAAGKEELAVRMTALLRDRENNGQVHLQAAAELAKLQGLYPDKGNGGVNVQIVLTEGLGG